MQTYLPIVSSDDNGCVFFTKPSEIVVPPMKASQIISELMLTPSKFYKMNAAGWLEEVQF